MIAENGTMCLVGWVDLFVCSLAETVRENEVSLCVSSSVCIQTILIIEQYDRYVLLANLI